MSCVAPPPMSPHPDASAFTVPMILMLNMVLVQYWHETKVARETPMRNRMVMYPAALSTTAMQKTAGAESMRVKAQP